MTKPRGARTPKLIEAAHVKNRRVARNDHKSRELQLGMASGSASENGSEQLAARLRGRILDLARTAVTIGLTINEAERQIEDHKGHSVSPRFAELMKRGYLIRVLVGYGPPTKRFPNGSPRFVTRYDQETRRNVNVHWVPEFAPASIGKCDPDHLCLLDDNADVTSTGSGKAEDARA